MKNKIFIEYMGNNIKQTDDGGICYIYEDLGINDTGKLLLAPKKHGNPGDPIYNISERKKCWPTRELKDWEFIKFKLMNDIK